MIWLLRFEWAGTTWYLANEFVTPERDNPDGTTTPIPHYATLEPPDFQEQAAFSIGSSSVGSASTSLEFRLDLGLDQDVAQLHFRDGQRLETAFGELALWTPGTPYQDRIVQISGPFTPNQVPLLNRPIRGMLTQRITTTAAVFPPPSAQATTTTWPNMPTDDEEGGAKEGFPYPVFIGSGSTFTSDAGTTKRTSIIQAILVDTAPNTLLIMYLHCVATTVKIWSVENQTAEDFTITLTTDALGQPVSVADISGAAWTWATGPETDTFYVTLLEGGVQSPTSTAAITGLGEAILYLLLQRYGDDGPDLVDVAAWETARPYLDQVRVGVLISEGVDPLSTITKILPMAPGLYLCQGPAGLRPVLFTSPPPAECVSLVARVSDRDGPDLFREPAQEPEIVMGDPVNEVTVYFAQRLANGDYLGSVTLDATNHPGAANSLSWYGKRSYSLACSGLYSRASAARIAGEILRLFAVRSTWDCYVAPMEVGASLYLGQRVRVTDDLASYDERPMSVIGRQLVTAENGRAWLITLVDFG